MALRSQTMAALCDSRDILFSRLGSFSCSQRRMSAVGPANVSIVFTGQLPKTPRPSLLDDRANESTHAPTLCARRSSCLDKIVISSPVSYTHLRAHETR